MGVSEQIVALRKEMGLSQQGLADACGVTLACVIQWESAGRGAKLSTYHRQLLSNLCTDNNITKRSGKLSYLDKLHGKPSPAREEVDPRELPNKISFLMSKGFSIHDLADELGGRLGSATIIKWLNGTDHPTPKHLSTINRMCTGLGYRPKKEKEV